MPRIGAKGYFNDRLIEVASTARLEALEVAGADPARVQVGKSYKFADPKLEALPAIQRTLVRMGPENALDREELAAGSPGAADPDEAVSRRTPLDLLPWASACRFEYSANGPGRTGVELCGPLPPRRGLRAPVRA